MATRFEEEERGSGPVRPSESGSSTQPLGRPDGAPDEKAELRRQREELAELHKQLDTLGRRRRRISVLRQIVAAVMMVHVTVCRRSGLGPGS